MHHQYLATPVAARSPGLPTTLRAATASRDAHGSGIRWRPWVRVVTVFAAFPFGLLIDRIGGGSSIDLLAPPVFAFVA